MKINNRLINPYERMDGLFVNYTKIKEVTELPNANNKATIYMNNEVGRLILMKLGISELVDYTKPIDYSEFIKIMVKVLEPGMKIEAGVYKTEKEAINNYKSDSTKYYLDLICDINKIFGNLTSGTYEDMTNDVKDQFRVVYIGNDINEIGNHDIEVEGPDYTEENPVMVKGGLYIIWEEVKEKPSTDTIYKKEILEETDPININYVFGENLGTIVGTEDQLNKLSSLWEQHKNDKTEWSNEAAYIGFVFSMYFSNSNIVDDGQTALNLEYNEEKSKYIFTTKFNGSDTVTTKEFDTIDELSTFIYSDESFTKLMGFDIPAIREYWTKYDLTPIYTSKVDESLDLTTIPWYIVMGPGEGVVHTGTYQYYIYNGSEYIEIGGNNGSTEYSQYVIKDISSLGTLNDDLSNLVGLTFTDDEINQLKEGKDLLLTFKNEDDGLNIDLKIFTKNKFVEHLSNDSADISYILLDIYTTLLTGTFKGYIGISNTNDGVVFDNYQIISIEQTKNIDTNRATINVNDWTENTAYSNYSNLGYKYQAIIAYSGSDTQNVVNVSFGITEALSGNFAPCTESTDNGVTIFAKEKPESNININYEVIY